MALCDILHVLPDADYEDCWLKFKPFVHKFYTTHPMPQLLQLIDDVPVISAKLNELQKRQEYDSIAHTINRFMDEFFWVCLKIKDPYMLSLCQTHLQRWATLQPPPPGKSVWMDHLCYLYSHIKLDLAMEQIRDFTSRDMTAHRQSLLDISLDWRTQGTQNSINVKCLTRLLTYYYDWTITEIQGRTRIILPKGIKDGTKVLKAVSSAPSRYYNFND